MIKRLFILLFCAVVIQPAVAQDATPIPTPNVDWIYSWGALVAFPEVVHFTITIDRPQNQIESLTLIISPTEQAPIEIPVSIVENADLADQFTNLSLTWEVPGDTPAPFSQVRYTWQVRLTDGSTGSVTDAFTFIDTRLFWAAYEGSEDVRYTIQAAASVSIETRLLNNAYQLMEQHTRRQPTFQVVVYPPDVAPACPDEGFLIDDVEIACDDAQLRAAYRDWIVLQAPTLNAMLHLSLSELFVQAFYAPVLDTLPAWFESGLAQLYIGNLAGASLETLRSAVRGDNLYNLEQMNRAENDNLWRAQAYAMTLYIADQIGIPSFVDLANEGGSFEAAYQNAVGDPLNELLPDLERWLFSESARSAFAYSLYLPETPTPTQTLTPTRTPTPSEIPPSSTPTATPTLTLTGIQRTSPPTWTPTRRPTEAPASRTPRPASAVRRTPTPSATPVPAAGVRVPNSPLFYLAAMIFFGMAGLAWYATRLITRRR